MKAPRRIETRTPVLAPGHRYAVGYRKGVRWEAPCGRSRFSRRRDAQAHALRCLDCWERSAPGRVAVGGRTFPVPAAVRYAAAAAVDDWSDLPEDERPGVPVGVLVDVALDQLEESCYLDVRTELPELEAAVVREMLASAEVGPGAADSEWVEHETLDRIAKEGR